MQTKICLCVLTSMTLQMTIPSCCSVSFVNLCLNVGLHSLCNWPNIRVSLFRLTENTTNEDSVEKIQSLFLQIHSSGHLQSIRTPLTSLAQGFHNSQPKGFIQKHFHECPAVSMPCCVKQSPAICSELTELSWTNGHSFPRFQKASRYRSISHRHPSIPIFQWEWFYYERNSQAINTLCLSMTLGIEFGGFIALSRRTKTRRTF